LIKVDEQVIPKFVFKQGLGLDVRKSVFSDRLAYLRRNNWNSYQRIV